MMLRKIKQSAPATMTSATTDPMDTVPTVRVGSLQAVPVVLRSLGFDPASVLAEVGFDLHWLDDPDHPMSYAARCNLLAHCAARTGCPHFGLLVGQQSGLDFMGLVGLLVKSSPDVGTALHSLVRYFHLHARGALTTLRTQNDVAVFRYDIYEVGIPNTVQTGDAAVAAMLNILRALCGPTWTPSEVLLAHRAPETTEPFRRFFHAPVRFDAEQYGMVFDARWLSHPLSPTDPEQRHLLQQEINRLETQSTHNLPEQLRRVLRTALATRYTGADQIADIFSMHPRTLSRRLAECGVSFQELLDEGRFEIARQLLRDSAMEVRQIADMLDYADASAFTRAFRRWSGTTPAQWRKTAPEQS